MRIFLFLTALFGLIAATPAAAEVREAAPGYFVLHGEVETTASPGDAWRAFQRIGRWWNGEHTYSNDAANLRLDPRAGGCWCERWAGGQSVEHGRVLLNLEAEGVRTVRFDAPLGPLQGMGVVAILTFTLAPHNQGTKITLSYRVSGDPGLALDQVAPFVDAVLMEQLGRLGRYSDTATPG